MNSTLHVASSYKSTPALVSWIELNEISTGKFNFLKFIITWENDDIFKILKSHHADQVIL